MCGTLLQQSCKLTQQSSGGEQSSGDEQSQAGFVNCTVEVGIETLGMGGNLFCVRVRGGTPRDDALRTLP